MNIDELVKQAEELKNESYNSPKVKIWKKKARDLVGENYGKDYLDILNSSLFFGQVIMGEAHGQQMHIEAMSKAIELLNSLKDEPTPQLKGDEGEKNGLALKGLHSEITSKCSSLFENREYPEAVEKGFKVVRDRLRQLTSFETGSEAFGKGKLHIRGAAAPHVDSDFNQGVKFLLMAIDMFRNEKSHTSDGNIDNQQRAYEYLSLCSLAMRFLDNAEIKK